MSFDPVARDQSALAETRREASASGISRAELVAELVPAVAFLLGSVGLWFVAPVHEVRWWPIGLAVLVTVCAMRVKFLTPFGFTVATQLAFVPLVLLAPPALLPPALLAAFIVSRLPSLRRRRWRGLVRGPANCTFALGPAWVFALAGAGTRADPGWLALALAAQLGADFLVSALACRLARGASLRAQLREAWWVWAIDVGLSPVALLVGEAALRRPVAVLAVIPLLGLLLMFARERAGRVEGLLALNENYRGTALLLGDVIGADDDYTGLHSRGVVELALAVGRELGLGEAELRTLEFGAMLHDIGKISIPKEILNKPGPLTDAEWAVMRTHPEAGQRMLARVGGSMDEVGVIVRAHHERWDGGGYPDGLLGEAAPLAARIITCCDSWSAMRTDRPYREALSLEAAVAQIERCAGEQFDPRVASTLLAVVAEQPAQPGAEPSPAVVTDVVPLPTAV